MLKSKRWWNKAWPTHTVWSVLLWYSHQSQKKKIEPLLTSEGKTRDQRWLSGQHVDSADRNQGLGRKRVLRGPQPQGPHQSPQCGREDFSRCWYSSLWCSCHFSLTGFPYIRGVTSLRTRRLAQSSRRLSYVPGLCRSVLKPALLSLKQLL